MNKIYIHTYLYLLAILTIIGCSDRYENYDPKYEGDRLVAIGILTENGIRVTLTKSGNPFVSSKEEDRFVNNGKVWLFENDILVGELKKQKIFEFVNKEYAPQIGLTYKIKAIAEGFDTLVSENITFPPPPVIKFYKLIKNDSLAINSYNGAVSFIAQLQDYISRKDNYMIDSYIQIKTDSIDPNRIKGTIYNGNTSDACEFDSWANIPFFTDKCFDGDEYTVNYFSEHERKGTLVVDFSSINQSFLRHLSSLDQPIGLEKGFAEPKIQYSNIKNGYGVFVAKNTKSFNIKLD